ncbi:MAG TPA: hypothetical protein PLI65_02655 [Bacteroidales bacterium]|nr:hypothetical protein [Bacteroidales bacterium]HPR58700.1 hypothetical protein [Bacteroidales bacterium]HRW97047.1 hypothetical protein [Bacteroidales bacterium]
MLIIIDKRLPAKAKSALEKEGQVLELETNGIVYDAISGHPDIFLTQMNDQLVVAPNLPDRYIEHLQKWTKNVRIGSEKVGITYPETARYNAVVSDNLLVHNLKITDETIIRQADGKKFIHVNQAYTRCNLIFITPSQAITSDAGIYKQLKSCGTEVFLFDPSFILLPGFKNGFFGGTCGLYGNRLFVTGNLKFHQQGKNLLFFCEKAGIDIIELYDGHLFDGGGIFFIKPA